MLVDLQSSVVLVAARSEQEAKASQQLSVLIELNNHGLLVLVAQDLAVDLLELLEDFVRVQIVVSFEFGTLGDCGSRQL
jgi:hypothetical protein